MSEQENPAPAPDAFMGSDPTSLPPQSSDKTTQVSVPQARSPMDMQNIREPKEPDMPKDSKVSDFSSWKNKFFKESIKNDVGTLLQMIMNVRDSDLSTYQKKFVEDNLQIVFLRQNSNINKASGDMRKKIRDDLDMANPGVSLTNHFATTLGSMPELVNTFIKISGYCSNKADLHRKYIASLIGAIQVGSGAQQEDIVYNEKTYSIRISTRFNSKFGSIDAGRWSLQQDDPEKYLADAELEKLDSGAPEEKKVLRHRIIIESIATSFEKRVFIVNVLADNGTLYFIGMDLSNVLRSGYDNGVLTVSSYQNDASEALFDSDGNLVTLQDIKIQYQKETGEMDENGNPLKDKTEFIVKKDGLLLINASLETLMDAAGNVNGLSVKELPFNGNPSDLVNLTRCVASTPELVLRNC
jgi:hypothetical protein